MSLWSDPPKGPVAMAISRDDPAMKEAYRLAASTLGDFIAHLKIADDRFCSVKLNFRDPILSERLKEDRLLYWWLDFATYHEDIHAFSAEFTELPDCLKGFHSIGQRLMIEPEDIFDWRVNHEGKLFGGFTIRVTRTHIPPEDLPDYDAYIGVKSFEDRTAP